MDKLDLILDRLAYMDARIESVDARIESMDARIESMDAKVDSIDTKVRDIQLTLENEIRTNIARVAEGHLDLSRKLNDVMKSNDEIEMMAVRLNVLESDVRDIKRRIS